MQNRIIDSNPLSVFCSLIESCLQTITRGKMKTISSGKVNFVFLKVFFITIFNVLSFSIPCLYADAQLLYNDDFEDGNINVATGAQGMTWTVLSGGVNLSEKKLNLNRGVGTVVVSNQSIDANEFTLSLDLFVTWRAPGRIMFLYKDANNYYSVRVNGNTGIFKTVNGVETKLCDGRYITFAHASLATHTMKIHVKRQSSGIAIDVDKSGDGIDYDLSVEDKSTDISGFLEAVKVGFADEGTDAGNPWFNIDKVALYSGEVINAHVPVTYYVDAALGIDTNSGTETQPFKTISKAANTVLAGDTVIVRNGNYPERTAFSDLSRRGGPGSFVTFKSETIGGAKTYEFIIDIDYVRIEGFDITTESLENISFDPRYSTGLFINANHIQVINNNIHDLRGAISSAWRPEEPSNKVGADVIVRGNRIIRANAGVGIGGQNWLVENNEIERLIQYMLGFDADYMRVFGENHVIRGNYCHGTNPSEIGDSHVDFLQTFDNNGEYARHILIEQNCVKDFHHQTFMLEGQKGSHDDFIIRNNLFMDAAAWGVCAHGVTNIRVENNTFVNNQTHGVGLRVAGDGSVSSGLVTHNIFYDWAGSQYNSVYWYEPNCQLSGDHNLIYSTTITNQQKISETDIANVDPLFVDASNPLGPDGIPFTDDDGFQLLPESPALHGGENGRQIGAYGIISRDTVALKQEVASTFQLSQNYPNPFNPSTVISYQLPTTSHISFKIFDILGREIATLINEVKKAGTHTVQWDGRNSAGQTVGSGVYFYQLKSGNSFVTTKKMMFLR